MAWVEITGEAEASGRLARIYAAARERAGRVANILKVQSQNPASLRSGVALYRDAMFGASPLTRAQREMLAVVVSAANNCDY